MLLSCRLPSSRLTRPSIAAGLPDESLEEINRLWTIARAFANTAHEVNNALQVIAGNAELLRAKGLEPAVQRRIDAISAETARASSLISTLQAYARSERDPAPTVDLAAIADRAVGLRTAALRRERTTVEVDSSSQRPLLVAGSGSRLLQILINLLLEAERSLRGKTAPRIVVRFEAEAGVAVVRVNAAASDLAAVEASPEEHASALLTADAQLWTARHLAERAGGSVTVAAAEGTRDWMFAVPAARAAI